MDGIKVLILGITFMGNSYAAVKAVRSLISYNKRLKEINSYEIRRDCIRLINDVECRN